MKEVLFIKNSLYGEKGEKRNVTDRAAQSYVKAGIAEYIDFKEDKAPAETKEEKQAQKAEKKQVKITKSPR